MYLCVLLAANALDFEVGDNLSFEVPLNHVSNALTAKNEVTIEFHNNDDAAVCLTELRFHIPSDNTGESDPVAVSLFVSNLTLSM